MLSTKPKRVLQLTLAIAAVSALAAACGGGGSDSPATPIIDPQPPTQPPPANPPPTNPPPTNPPPTNPPPADTVTLADDFTDLDVTLNTSVLTWPGWTGGSQTVDGVGCANTVNYHIHTLVSIYRNASRLALPDNVGRGGCTYALHTHDHTGVIHNETDVPTKFMLSQFFSLWRQPYSATNIAGLEGPYRFYLIEDGKLTRYTGDPMALELTAHREIVILTGPNPPSVLPKYRWSPGCDQPKLPPV